MPDDLLAPLATGPVPALASAGQIRARGDRRRRRSRAALLGTAALLLVLAGARGVAVLGGDQPDADHRDLLEVSTPDGAAYDVRDALLTPVAADRAEDGAWTVSGQVDDRPLLDPCGRGAAYPRDADRVDRAAVELSAPREAGGTTVGQQVARYTDAAAASAAYDDYLQAVRDCPRNTFDPNLPPSIVTTAYVGTSGAGLDRRFLVRQDQACPSCTIAPVYYAVQQVDDAVSVVTVTVGEDGDPGAGLVERFATVVSSRLQQAVRD